MKKHDEGYVLAFVLVVTLVLAIVATSILTAALRNFSAQQESIARMEDRYAAQGEIEKIVALIKTNGGTYTPDATNGVTVSVKENTTDVLIAQKGQVVITCDLALGNSTLTQAADGKIKCPQVPSVAYESYTISTTGGAAE